MPPSTARRTTLLLGVLAFLALATAALVYQDALRRAYSDWQTKNRILFNIEKLKDRSYVTIGEEHIEDDASTWFIAAEELGLIGEPAIPYLIKRLDTEDQYELMLALYALLLASQDHALKAKTGGDYVHLTMVLTEKSNVDNMQVARVWWQKHKHLWGE